MDEQRYQELTEKYANMLDGPDTPERREWMAERMRRKYEEETRKSHSQKPAS